MKPPLAIIPTFLSEVGDVALLADCVTSLRETAGQPVDILIVDDCSPAQDLLDAFERDYSALEFEVHRSPTNEGFSRSVNTGMDRALSEGRDALLVNADIEFGHPHWLQQMLAQRNLHSDGLASVVGAMLCYPSGLIQHGGIYMSLLTRSFDHLHKYAPMNLEAARQPRSCPVTGALQLIRHECLGEVGVYDPEFRMAFEDVDYCLRVFMAGRECVYCPGAIAYHHESIFRSRKSEKLEEWHKLSYVRLAEKYQDVNFATMVPYL